MTRPMCHTIMILMLGGWLLNIKFSTKKNDNIDVSNNNDFVALVGDGNVDTDIGVSHNYFCC